MILSKMIPFALLAMLMGRSATASPLTFDFKDPKEISAVSLTLDSKLEPIVGYAKGISGFVHFDPANPQATTGSVAVTVNSVQFANEGYTATARGYALNGDKHPQILFNLRHVESVTRLPSGVYQAIVKADFVCKGVTLPLTVPVTASYYPGLAEERTNGKYRGDVLVLRTHFGVSRKKLGISQGIPDSMVGDTVEVGVAVVGLRYAAQQPKPDTTSKQADNQAGKEAVTTKPMDGKNMAATQTLAEPMVKPIAGKPTAGLWKMEIEDRDDPIKADMELDVNAPLPTVSFTTARGRITADHATLTGSKLAFHLPDNPQRGAADGEALFEGGTVRGLLVTKAKTIKFHGRPRRAGDDAIQTTNAVTVQSSGFRDLMIQADGANKTLAERMSFYHVPAVSLARFKNYQVVETGAFGVADVESGAAVNTNTLFQAGGMGSPLVNLLALRLVAQHRLDWNREANAYLKGAKIPDNAFTRTRKITVLDLINGASGLSQYKFTGYAPAATPPTLSQLIAGADLTEMQTLRVERVPGMFGGEGVCGAILEQVMADATGRPFAELMQENVFAPLGMTHSVYETFPDSNTRRTVALGHYSTGELMLDRYHVYPEAGESGLWTTAGDFARMLCEVQRMTAGKPNRILTADQRGLLKALATDKWFLGLIKSDGKGFLPADWLYHGGASYGFYANHATHQDNGSGVVVMENRSLGWQLNNEIIRAVGAKEAWFTPAFTLARLDQMVSLDIRLPRISADPQAQPLNLAQIGNGKNLVLFFFSEQCGVTYRYKQRLQRLQKEFTGGDFAFVGVRCGKRENPNAPLTLAETQYLIMPFADDATGALTKLFRVRQSLTFAVIDRASRLRYKGGFDDNVDAARVTASYLPNALRALASGKPVTMKEGRAIGCAILPIQ